MSKKYLMSFTTGGLFLTESLQVIDLYDGDWDETQSQALNQNILQTRTASSAKRRLREIVGRLKMLNIEELTLLENGSMEEQKQLLWVSICRRYDFINEFAREVVRERYVTLMYDLPPEEFEVFYNAKAQWHEELDSIAESTRNKLRNVLFKILREAEIIDTNNLILPTMLSDKVAKVVAKSDLGNLEVFPISDIDLHRIVS